MGANATDSAAEPRRAGTRGPAADPGRNGVREPAAEAGRIGVRERLARKAKALDRRLTLELNHDPSRAALVLGSGRSGTTWLAEAMAHQFRSRLLFEPFHPLWGSVRDELRLFSRPSDRNPALERAVRRVLSGRVRTAHIEQAFVRFPRSRIVKDVHAVNLLPWLRVNFPGLPVVFIVRHPIASALSRLRSSSFHGLADYLDTPAGREDAEDSPVSAWLPVYDSYREHGEPLVRRVAEWCIENAYPLCCIEDEGVALAFYETLVLDPVAELDRLGEHCRPALGPAARAPYKLDEVRRPSAMDWFGTAAAARRSGDWERLLSRWQDEVPQPTTELCLSVLSDFRLEWLYGEGPMPLAEGPTGSPHGSRSGGAA